MLPLKNPCTNCLVEPLGCNRMCPEVIEYYRKRVRKRSKDEVQQATGYYWEDDYVDDNGITHMGHVHGRIEREVSKEESEFIPVKIKPGIIEKFINFINKGK